MGTRGIEVQHKWFPFAGDTLVWGANVDQKFSEGPSIGGKHTHDLPGVFLDNTYDVTDQISLNAGLRCDKHPNTDYTVSNRLSLLYSPHERHNFRLTWGNSYRNPDFVENYYSRISPYGEGKYLHVFGQEDNDPEKADTWELGYYGQVSETCILSINLFYSYLDDFIYFIQEGDPYFDETRNGVIIPYPYTNIGDAKQYGAEVEVNLPHPPGVEWGRPLCFTPTREGKKPPGPSPLGGHNPPEIWEQGPIFRGHNLTNGVFPPRWPRGPLKKK